MIISNPKRPLDPAEEVSCVEYYCRKIVPYVLLACIIIFLVILFIVLVKYGRLWFSTPQNHVEHMNEIIGYYGGVLNA